jgi:hypothetical protein
MASAFGKVPVVLARKGASHARCMTTRVFAVFALAAVSMFGCYKGDDPEKQPPPGWPGGKCLAPNGTCRGDAICNHDEGTYYCYNPQDPCEGFFCGGSTRGMCVVAEGLPACQCMQGFSTDLFALYCCPDPNPNPQNVFDPLCVDDGDGGGIPDGDGSGDGGGTGTSSLVDGESDL